MLDPNFWGVSPKIGVSSINKSSSSNLPLSRASDKNDLKESIALFPKNPNMGLKMFCCLVLMKRGQFKIPNQKMLLGFEKINFF